MNNRLNSAFSCICMFPTGWSRTTAGIFGWS